MSTTAIARSTEQQVIRFLQSVLQTLLLRFPKLVFRVMHIAFDPAGRLRQVALVLVVQVVSFLLQRFHNQRRRGILIENDDARLQGEARTYAEWLNLERSIQRRLRGSHVQLANNQFFVQLQQRADRYAALQAGHDEYGLMFHLRSELMRKQSGGAGYSRDGSTWLRKHAAARERIHAYQETVCSALRYIAADERQHRPAERLAFINETRHAFGRTALLLSGGAAFGVKHIGVVSALHRESLLPRIVCGTSAGSIVAGAVCSRNGVELRQLLDDASWVAGLKFFDVRTKQPREGQVEQTLLDSRVLEETILNLIGNVTFLEAFDKTGRVLNITVTRSDGKAPPLLCNYLTTPHMLVHSASLASCAIPGVFEAVQLQMRGRNGEVEPYFKTGGWTWTDGGLQADLPKQRLTELFNVNQFIVSQVNPLAPLFVPVDGTGVPWLEECNDLLKSQLVGFVQGISKLWNGRLVRPGGFRGVDFVLQDYEGTVTIRPSWGLREMSKFLANFDDTRIDKYIRDGERATWPQMELIRSLCEIEYCLDEVAAELQRTMAIGRSKQRLAAKAAAICARDTDITDVLNEDGESSTARLTRGHSASIEGGPIRGKVPSYVSLSAYDGRPAVTRPPSIIQHREPHGSREEGVADRSGSAPLRRLPGVASSASLANLASLEMEEGFETSAEAIGMAPFQSANAAL